MSLSGFQVSISNQSPEVAAFQMQNSRSAINLKPTTFVKSPSCYRNLNKLENPEISITPVRRRSSISSGYEPQQYKDKQLTQPTFDRPKFSPLPSFFYLECDASNNKPSKSKLKSSWKRFSSFKSTRKAAQPQATTPSCQENKSKVNLSSPKLSFLNGFIKRNQNKARDCDYK